VRLPVPLRAAAFRSVWLAGLVSDTGDWLLLIALPVVVYDLTGSALGTSLAFIVELAPGIVLAPLAGWCADRFDRRRVLVTVSLAQAAALLPLFAIQTRADLPILYAVILSESALLTVFDPTKNAFLPTLVSGNDLVAANSLVGLGQNLARLVGGPVGGVLLAAGGLRVVAAADLISYLAAAVLIRAGRAGHRREPHPPGVRQERAPDRQRGSYCSSRSSLRSRKESSSSCSFCSSFSVCTAARPMSASCEVCKPSVLSLADLRSPAWHADGSQPASPRSPPSPSG
jgi:MFS family permease